MGRLFFEKAVKMFRLGSVEKAFAYKIGEKQSMLAKALGRAEWSSLAERKEKNNC